MPTMRTVHIMVEEDTDTGKSRVLVQVGMTDPVDTGIRAESPEAAAKMVADRIGGRA